MHVDTVSTHVVSAIINVDQGEIEKDWPLLILDHDDNEHNVVMKPGDMLLYESAKLLHGRPGMSCSAVHNVSFLNLFSCFLYIVFDGFFLILRTFSWRSL
jgi:prolyl 4-hydroxylase